MEIEKPGTRAGPRWNRLTPSIVAPARAGGKKKFSILSGTLEKQIEELQETVSTLQSALDRGDLREVDDQVSQLDWAVHHIAREVRSRTRKGNTRLKLTLISKSIESTIKDAEVALKRLNQVKTDDENGKLQDLEGEIERLKPYVEGLVHLHPTTSALMGKATSTTIAPSFQASSEPASSVEEVRRTDWTIGSMARAAGSDSKQDRRTNGGGTNISKSYDKKSWGQELKRRRNLMRPVTSAERFAELILGNKSGVSNVRRWEAGTQLPREEHACKIADVLPWPECPEIVEALRHRQRNPGKRAHSH